MGAYKNVINSIITVCENNVMIESVSYKPLYDLSSIKNETYPTVLIIPQTSTGFNNMVNMTLVLTVMDRLQEDSSNMLDVHDDMEAIVWDILSDINNKYTSLGFELLPTSVTCTPFTDKYEDIVAGWDLKFTVSVPRPFNSCVTPKTDLEV